MNTPTYIASDDFESQLMWLKTSRQSELMMVSEDRNDKPTERVTCAVVGTISSNRLFLEPHGNFNPNFNNGALENAKAQFMLVAPSADGIFHSDFKTGIERIERIQNKAVSEGPHPQYFIVTDGDQTGLKFSWPLFEKRDFEYDSQDEEDWSNGYPITDAHQKAFKAILPKWRATPLPAYDESGNFIKIQDHELTLKGALVLVYFQLKHYTIKDRNSNGVLGNTFTAIATQIKILERAAKRNTSPYKTQMLKGPINLPRSPTKHKEQVEAVNAFHPGTGTKASSNKPITIPNTPNEVTHSSFASPHTSNPGGSGPLSISKEGKKRAIDDDEEATATEGEASNATNSIRKKKKAVK
ncbi:hypothetical protein BYT27DRAFT_7343617 [Phlegmacium glaucopus]|nr:hypothetical protein BYT27DRAFT_7343617 [Phlegmacium glaucopus]